MNWTIKIISKTLMTEIPHISWGVTTKGVTTKGVTTKAFMVMLLINQFYLDIWVNLCINFCSFSPVLQCSSEFKYSMNKALIFNSNVEISKNHFSCNSSLHS